MNLRAFTAAAVLASLPNLAASQAPSPAPPPAAPAEVAPPPTAPPLATPPPAAAPPPAVAPAPPPPVMQPPPPPAKVAQPAPSRWRGSFTLGAGTSYGQNYFMAGARLGYILSHGLAAELEGQYWMGASPQIGKIAPGLTWYSPYRLYVGAYYARWFVGSGFPDSDAVGGRAGLTLTSRGPAVVGVGVAYERTLNCSRDCDAWWPEASVGVSF